MKQLKSVSLVKWPIKAYIYRGAKPVYWSWSSESALAEAEIEYHDLVSTSLYYANKVKDGKGVLDTDTYIVVWTTTPFTITASRGLTVGAEFDYVVVQPAGLKLVSLWLHQSFCQACLKNSVGLMFKFWQLTVVKN